MCRRNGVTSDRPMTIWVTSVDSEFAGVQGSFDSFGVTRHAGQEIAYQGVGTAHSSEHSLEASHDRQQSRREQGVGLSIIQ